MKLIKFMLLISATALASNTAIVQKVLSTKFGKKESELVQIYGQKTSTTQEKSVWKNKDYLFVWNKKKSLYYLDPKKLNVQELPFKSYEFKRSSKGDQNLGGIVSLPGKGMYMTVDPDGNVSRLYWKSPWKDDGHKLSKPKIIELLRSPEAAQ